MSFITYDFINGDYIKLNFEFFFLLFISFEGLSMAGNILPIIDLCSAKFAKKHEFFFRAT